MGALPLGPTSMDRPVGWVWRIGVLVTDDETGLLTDDVPVVTITLPNGATITPTVDEGTSGAYFAEHVLAVAGRYIATAATADNGTASFTVTAVALVPAAGMPDLAEARDYLGETSATDDEIQRALDAEAAAQRAICRVPAAYPDDLRDALLRRVARNLAMHLIPIAVLQGDAETGQSAAYPPGRDPEVRRFEAPHRRLTAR
jgi:hypothetical protein